MIFKYIINNKYVTSLCLDIKNHLVLFRKYHDFTCLYLQQLTTQTVKRVKDTTRYSKLPLNSPCLYPRLCFPFLPSFPFTSPVSYTVFPSTLLHLSFFLIHLLPPPVSPPSLHPSIHLSDWSSQREDRCRANSS